MSRPVFVISTLEDVHRMPLFNSPVQWTNDSRKIQTANWIYSLQLFFGRKWAKRPSPCWTIANFCWSRNFCRLANEQRAEDFESRLGLLWNVKLNTFLKESKWKYKHPRVICWADDIKQTNPYDCGSDSTHTQILDTHTHTFTRMELHMHNVHALAN